MTQAAAEGASQVLPRSSTMVLYERAQELGRVMICKLSRDYLPKCQYQASITRVSENRGARGNRAGLLSHRTMTVRPAVMSLQLSGHFNELT